MSMVGFDFGTTNSLISIIDSNGDATHFLDERNRPIPSAAGYEGTRKILGRAAKERLSEAGLGTHGNILRSPKRYLGEESITIDGAQRNPVDIVADVVRHVCDLAKSSGRTLDTVTNAVVTIPVDMGGHKRRALRDAFAQAGVRIAQFVHEPFAALYGFFRSGELSANLDRYDDKLVLVFDWGGGTLDLTLCRIIGDTVVQVMNDGTDEVGGDVFDETVMKRILTKVTQEKGLGDENEVQPGAMARLLEACERAKIDLSGRSSAGVYVGNFFRNTDEDDVDYTLTKEELEDAVGPLLDRGFKRIHKVLADAGYGYEQVDLCLATGGMSNMPTVRQRLHAWFGPQRVRVPDETATLIAEGAARIAADNASLHLAKNVELELARSSYLPLLKAGTRMPRAGTVTQAEDFHLYCTDPRDGKAKFQICTPMRAGRRVRPNEPRTCLETMTVKVDSKARVFQERLELTVQVRAIFCCGRLNGCVVAAVIVLILIRETCDWTIRCALAILVHRRRERGQDDVRHDCPTIARGDGSSDPRCPRAPALGRVDECPPLLAFSYPRGTQHATRGGAGRALARAGGLASGGVQAAAPR